MSRRRRRDNPEATGAESMSDEKISVHWVTDEPLLPDAGVTQICDMAGNPVADVLFERDGSLVKIFGVPR